MPSLPPRLTPARAGRLGVVLLASAALAVPGVVSPALATDVPADAAVRAEAALPGGAIAETGTVDTPRTSPYEGTDYSAPDKLYSYPLDGDLGSVTVDERSRTLTVRTLDPADGSEVGTGQVVTWDPTWPIFGDLYAAPDGTFYLLVGQKNLAQEDDRPVVAVQRYSAAWQPIGDPATVEGGGSFGDVEGIRIPFDVAAPSLVQVGDRLVVHFAREIYGDTPDDRHQASFLAGVDIATMTATTFTDEGGSNYAQTYASHSWRQIDVAAGDNLLVVDHGDAFPRAIQLGIYTDYADDAASGAPFSIAHNLFNFSGGVGDNTTGTTLDGVAASSTGSLTVGTSVPHRHAVEGVRGRDRSGGGLLAKNLWMVTAPPVLPDPANPADPEEQGTFTWLTRLDPRGRESVTESRLVPLGSDRYALMFGVEEGRSHRFEYRLLDAEGAVLASASWAGAWFSPASQPTVVGDRVMWLGHDAATSSDDLVAPSYLYGLDLTDPAEPMRLGADDPIDPEPSDDAALGGLTAASARLTPVFDPAVTSYRVRLTRRSSSASLSWLPRDAGATASYRVGAKPFTVGTAASIGVKPGRSKAAQIRVVAADGVTTTTYQVTLTRRR